MMMDQITENIIAQFSLDIGSTDHRDALRIEEIVKVFHAAGGDVVLLCRFADKHSGVHRHITVRIEN